MFKDFQIQPPTQLPSRGTVNGLPKMNSISPANGRQSPFKFPSQSTASLQATPNSSISQDSAFPPFPTSRSRSTTPTTPSDINQSFASYSLDQQNQRDSYSGFAPLSPRDNGGGSVLQRMNAIAPGPFNLSNKGNPQPSGHKKTATMGSSKDFSYQSVGTGKGHSSRPSTAGSNNSRKPSLSSISGGPRSTVNRSRSEIPNESLPLRRSQTAEMVDGESTTTTGHEESLIGALRQENRSRTYPLDDPDQKRGGDSRRDAARRPSAPSLHVTRPSVAAAIRPLHEIGSVSSFKSSRSIRLQSQSSVAASTREPSTKAKNGNEISEEKKHETPNLSAPNYAQSYVVGNPHHTSNQSVSSNDSSGSDGKTGSSMSTPPLSASPRRQKRRPSNLSQGGSLMREFQFGLEDKPVFNDAPHDAPTLSLKSSMDMPLGDPSLSIEPGTLAPGLMRDPAIHSGRASPLTPDDSFNPFPLESGNLLLSPAPPPHSTAPTSPLRKPAKVNKGRCRGCGELIVGKSVCSADGRLTGRYHKRCFVCLTCKEPFRTADFYVLDNHPYCERHYHQLNNSICGACDRGIEGQYLETELKQKFHLECFKCQVGVIGRRWERKSANVQQDCQTVLRNDYFEVNGQTWCERHATGAAQQPSILGAGRRHPERRTTRLMMM